MADESSNRIIFPGPVPSLSTTPDRSTSTTSLGTVAFFTFSLMLSWSSWSSMVRGGATSEDAWLLSPQGRGVLEAGHPVQVPHSPVAAGLQHICQAGRVHRSMPRFKNTKLITGVSGPGHPVQAPHNPVAAGLQHICQTGR